MNQRISDVLSGKTTRYVFPFFWLRGEDEATLRHYMQVIHDAGCHAVCLESRPHPDFCGPRWWHDLDIIIDEAKKLDMKLWILDDSHFPTGYCNGALHQRMEQGDWSLLRQSVTYRVLAECTEGESVRLSYADICLPGEPVQTRADKYFMKPFPYFADEQMLAAVAVQIGEGNGRKISFQLMEGQDLIWTAEAGRWRVYGIYSTRNRGPRRDYMNMLSLSSCRTLIDAVYEPHWQHYRAEFGKTILGFFSDEPEIGNGHIYQTDKRLHEVEDLPWSDELKQELERRWGSTWLERIPLLWEQEADPDQAAQTRYQYMNVVTRLVQRDFSEQVGTWCRAHGVSYIGHLIEDHGQHTRCGSSLGHYFRGLAGQDMAGIDDIGGQVLPQGEDLNIRSKWQDHRDGTFYHFALGKLAASAAAIEPRKQGDAMCEIFGNYGWSEGVTMEKYLADHFMVRGLNHFVPHAFSAAPFPDKDCPPHFYAHGNNPQYRHFGELIRYMERVCHLISGGRADVRAAVLYHAEADWTIGKNQPCEAIGRVLAEHQIDYHFIPSDVFEEREKYLTSIDAKEKCLRINRQAYRLLIVPESSYLSSFAARAMAEMRQAGVPVWIINALPEGICSMEGTAAEKATVLQDMQKVPFHELSRECEGFHLAQIHCSPASPSIRCLHYMGRDYELYYIVNEAAEEYSGVIRFPGIPEKGTFAYQYDAWNNRCLPVEMEPENSLRGTWEPSKGYMYVVENGNASLNIQAKAQIDETRILMLKNWTRSVCSSAAYPHFSREQAVSLPDEYEKENPTFGGFIRYETEIFCGQQPASPVELVIPGQQEGIEVFVNGASAGIQIVPTYRFEISSLLCKGCNTLRIEQATTLERAVPKSASVSLASAEPNNHLGIHQIPYLLGLDTREKAAARCLCREC